MKNQEQIKSYREQNAEKLGAELLDLQKKLANASLKVSAGKLDDYSSISKIKKNIARVKSIINEKGME